MLSPRRASSRTSGVILTPLPASRQRTKSQYSTSSTWVSRCCRELRLEGRSKKMVLLRRRASPTLPNLAPKLRLRRAYTPRAPSAAELPRTPLRAYHASCIFSCNHLLQFARQVRRITLRASSQNPRSQCASFRCAAQTNKIAAIAMLVKVLRHSLRPHGAGPRDKRFFLL